MRTLAAARPLLREALRTVALLLVALLLVQGLVRWAPGPEEAREGAWLARALRGDLGRDRTGRPVRALLLPAIGVTARLGLAALLLGSLLASPLALALALRPRSGSSWIARGLVSLLSASPIFLLGYFLALYASRVLGRIPGGRADWLGDGVGARALALIAPPLILAVGDGGLSELTRQLAAELRRILREPHLAAARARGARLGRHVLRALWVPGAFILSQRAAALLGGAVVLEAVFNLRGLGYLTWQAAVHRDVPVLMGSTAAAVAVTRAASLAASLVLIRVDPRVREREGKAP